MLKRARTAPRMMMASIRKAESPHPSLPEQLSYSLHEHIRLRQFRKQLAKLPVWLESNLSRRRPWRFAIALGTAVLFKLGRNFIQAKPDITVLFELIPTMHPSVRHTVPVRNSSAALASQILHEKATQKSARSFSHEATTKLALSMVNEDMITFWWTRTHNLRMPQNTCTRRRRCLHRFPPSSNCNRSLRSHRHYLFVLCESVQYQRAPRSQQAAFLPSLVFYAESNLDQ